MRTALKWAIVFAVVPILGWLASLAHNWWLGGEFFHYSPMAYMPLVVVTFPCEGILRWMSDVFGEHTHPVAAVYTLVTSAIYGLAGLILGYVLRTRNNP